MSSTGAQTWHIVQHEGFHQFAHAVIGGELPVWVNEGLAEYFGESLFTGDSFVTGVIPPDRLARIKEKIRNNTFKPVPAMMLMTSAEWNAAMQIDYYDQAWSMAHFLAHGDDGKYQAAFSNFMIDIGRGKDWQKAWQANFGSAEGFEERWKQWWLALPDDPTAGRYAEATAAMLTSFLSRAASQKQSFPDMAAFAAAAKGGELKAAPADWLPPSLLTMALTAMNRDDTQWTLEFDPAKTPHGVGTMADKTRVVGSFTGPGKVTVEVDDLAVVIDKATALIADQKKADAMTLLKAGIAKHPRSPSVNVARKLITDASRSTRSTPAR